MSKWTVEVDSDTIANIELHYPVLFVPERTCHVVSTIRYDYEGGYAGSEYVTGLSCGHKHTDSYGDAPNFCSKCGAKVVE